jgi:tetratricopeptide (TPR) repeat protein
MAVFPAESVELMKNTSPWWALVFLIVVCFTLSTSMQLEVEKWNTRAQSNGLLTILLGDGRRLFANHFFVKADVYFHSGYYPSFFDQAAKIPPTAKHLTEEHHDEHEEEEHEKAMDFLGRPKDWIDSFGRHFYPSTHSHLDKPGEAREILPWLRLSADMDPHRVETYTVASFWLRKELGKPDEAEQFLREGLRENPGSYEILMELGQVYDENRHDPARAANLWELALRHWQEQDARHQHPDDGLYLQILIHLEHAEEEQGDYRQALHYREIELEVTPQPEIVRKQIAELQEKLANGSATKKQ